MTLKIPYGLVVITGPAATGKTTLATRILRECPRMNKRLLKFPEILLSRKTGGNTLGDDTGLRARLGYMYSIEQSYKDGVLAICDGCYLNESGMNSFLYQLRAMRVYYDTVIIKMAPEVALHKRYIIESGRTDISPAILDKQTAEFRLVQRYSYQEHISWVKHDYLVRDPENISLIFS